VSWRTWGPALTAQRPGITMAMCDSFVARMFGNNPDFVFTVTGDLMRGGQNPILVLPDDAQRSATPVAHQTASLKTQICQTTLSNPVKTRANPLRPPPNLSASRLIPAHRMPLYLNRLARRLVHIHNYGMQLNAPLRRLHPRRQRRQKLQQHCRLLHANH